jgi:hypothetical protein
MADPILWPHEMFRSADTVWSLNATSVSGGRPFSGATGQAVSFSGGGLWKAKFVDIRIRSREQVNAWHALEALLSGSVQTVIVPRCDRRHGPRTAAMSYVPHSDGSPFGDGSLYLSAQINAETTQAADLRDTTLTISISGGRPLIGGEHFSIDHGGDVGWRMYRVARVWTESGETTIEMRPPARADIPAGTRLEWDLPRCTMRLADPNGMELTLQQLKRAQPSIEFREHFE